MSIKRTGLSLFGFRRLELQPGFAAGDPLVLQLFGAGLVLPEYFHECAGRKPERRRCRLRVARLCRHDVEYVRDEQREKRIGRLYVAIAPGKRNFGVCGRFADVQGDCHLHPVQRMGLIFLRAPRFAGFDF